ncbi:MAG: hypothetical protein PHW64_03965 [Sulfuricurvum sp.]|nr:hypothetical protein [Sulfuricurvum sp.]
MQRGGAVLLMTLLLITIITGAMGILIAQSNRILRMSQQSLGDAQVNKIYADLKQILPDELSKIGSPRELDYAMMLPLSITSEDGRFEIEASFRPANERFNINLVSDLNGTLQEPYSKFLTSLFTRYPIAAPETFTNILLDTIDGDVLERQSGSEIGADFGDFHSGSVEDFTQFWYIVARYIEITKDKQILRIPWTRLIGFKGDKIDINYISAELLSLVAPELDGESARRFSELRIAPYESKEQFLSAAPQLSSLYDKWFTIYTPGNSYPLRGDVLMRRDGIETGFAFEVDLKTKVMSRLELKP